MQNIIALSQNISAGRISLAFTLKRFWFFFIVLIVAFLIFYIIQINSLASENYSVLKLKKDIKAMAQENEKLQATFAGTISLKTVEDLILERQFEKINTIQYIQITENPIVIAK